MERYVAAIEISSSKIIGVVGRVKEGGQVDIIAVEQEKSIESVRYGIIQNLEDSSRRLARILDKLEHKSSIAPRKIERVFIGLNARSLRSIPVEVSLQLPDETEINDEIINRLRKDALNAAIDSSLEIVDAVPRKYRIGKQETSSPKGVLGNAIEAEFDIIVCRPEVKRNIVRVVRDKLGIEIAGFVVTPLATGHLILSAEEKRLGCMLADIGAETTAVTIYQHGALRYFATLPLGGRNITRDITSKSMLEEQAEEIKRSYGNAIPPEIPSKVVLNGVKLAEVGNIIVARSEEIVANIIEQISYAGLKERDLPGGVICIGGCSKLNGLTELLSQQLGGNSVKIGRLPAFVHIDDVKGPSSEIVEVASVLYAGATLTKTECLVTPTLERAADSNFDTEEEQTLESSDNNVSRSQKPLKFVSAIRNSLSKLFATPEDDDSGELE